MMKNQDLIEYQGLRVANHRRPTIKQFCKALHESGGVISNVLRAYGIGWTVYNTNYKPNPEVQKALEESRRIGTVKVIDSLMQRAIDGDVKSIRLYLQYSPYAKEAGWYDEKKIFIKSEKPLTQEEKDALAKSLFGSEEGGKQSV